MKKIGILCALCAILIFFSAFNCLWLKQDNIPLWYDYGLYFDRSVQIYYASFYGPKVFIDSLLGLNDFNQAYHPHRPFLPLVSIFLYPFLGVSEDSAVATMLVFFAILIFSMYAIGKKMFGSLVGILAAAIIPLYTEVIWSSRHYSTDFAVMSLVSLSILLLLKSENFSNRIYSLLFGLTVGLGMLTKEIFVVYILGPLSFSVLTFFPRRGFDSNIRLRIKNILFAFFWALLIISFWYIPHLRVVLSKIFEAAYSENIRIYYKLPSVLSFAGLSFYVTKLVTVVSPFYLIAFYLGTVSILLHLKGKPNNRNIMLLLLWILVSYIILTTAPDKAECYLLGILPALAMITALGLSLIRSRIIKYASILILVLFGSMQFLVTSFKNFNQFNHYKIGYSALWPRNENWKINEIISYLESTRVKNKILKTPLSVVVVPNMYEFSWINFMYRARIDCLKYTFLGIFNQSAGMAEFVLSNEFDFVIFKSAGNQGLFITSQESEIVRERLVKSSSYIELPKRFELPDAKSIVIYMRKPK
jgi:4-amino-4-deoxy-L-arabinose transferase-like glycosyltransferase